MTTETALDASKKAVAAFNWQEYPFREFAILLGQSAGVKKTQLYHEDFSKREFALGKLVGYLEALEDILALPAQLRAEGHGVTPGEKTRKPRLRPTGHG